MKLIPIVQSAMPRAASWCVGDAALPVARVRRFSVSATTPEPCGLEAGAAAKLRQEKAALTPGLLGVVAFAYHTTDTVSDLPAAFGRPVGDRQITTTNGAVQCPPPWRWPVTT